ncbi:SUMO ligase SIZ1 NDAI_0A04170 [Naumovozyma dairenensis CBS 421]|uniref:SP-RING-type domain-containing protein n=1 Tax=Naumovozyma dairenensis (strain ATCC 10597 / BCRC 20456 / CBS 421 / NBRC 0211 / NRRL Y-12639) TaxID=1071378 RepID=G0W436_NAUDC|nr:hypothetical protein NDAI_0A04170 [Naumovozyma dairenensis CBS 421]CCD22574.1 hypothetical protein NDAI_0A04170 [Naumovozyma dairenensis CBS 421]
MDNFEGSDRVLVQQVQLESQKVITKIELLKVKELKPLSKAVGLGVSFRKPQLQEALRKFILESQSPDIWKPKTVSVLIDKIHSGEELPSYETLYSQLRHNITPIRGSSPSAVAVASSSPQSSYSEKPAVPPLHFKESPFFKLKRLIPQTAQPVKKIGGRGIALAKFRLSPHDYELLSKTNKYKLYLFCAKVNELGSRGNEFIEFPTHCEVRFNNVRVPDNVKGLKNKPGTTKPADLTPYIRNQNQENILQLIYAMTTSEYRIYCYVVELVPPEDLLQQVLAHPKIIRQATLYYLANELNEDNGDDLITTSIVMSLQCPISYTKMNYPAKSIICKHLQCFDALWFLHSQWQVPTWQCPICTIKIELKDLAICEFVEDILKNSGDEVEQVELAADGRWTAFDEEDPKNQQKKPIIQQSKVKMENDGCDQMIPEKQEDNSPREMSKENLDKDRNINVHGGVEIITLESESEDEQDEQERGQEQQPEPIEEEENQERITETLPRLSTERTVLNKHLSTVESSSVPMRQEVTTPKIRSHQENSINFIQRPESHISNESEQSQLVRVGDEYNSNMRGGSSSVSTPIHTHHNGVRPIPTFLENGSSSEVPNRVTGVRYPSSTSTVVITRGNTVVPSSTDDNTYQQLANGRNAEEMNQVTLPPFASFACDTFP